MTKVMFIISIGGHPIVGDTRYGARLVLPPSPDRQLEQHMRGFTRHALHARRLEFEHPTLARTIEVQSQMPEDIANLIKACAQDLTHANG